MSGVDTIYQLVQDDVKRPDKQAQIWRRIHRSILKMHTKDFWRKDLIEQVYQFPTSTAASNQSANATGANSLFMNWFGDANSTLNVQQIPTANLQRFRKIEYIRKWQTVDPYGLAILDPITGQNGTVQGGDLTERTPSLMDDGYGFDLQDTFYLAGEDININSSTPLSAVYIGYLSKPKVNLGCTTLDQFQDYISWIADDNPALIACDVKKYIFADIGKLEAEIKGAQVEYQEELLSFLTSAVNLSTRKG